MLIQIPTTEGMAPFRRIRRLSTLMLLALSLASGDAVPVASATVPATVSATITNSPPSIKSPDPRPAKRYILRLSSPALATYTGGLPGLAPTAPSAGGPRIAGEAHLDLQSPEARAYLSHLRSEQDRVLQRLRVLAPDLRLDWRYRHVLNGLAVQMTDREALRALALPGVESVHAAEYFAPELDSTIPHIGALEAWAEAGGAEEAGLGARIAIVDTGMDARHPFFADEGMPDPPEGYPSATLHLRDGTVLDYPQPERFVNGKLIAARAFITPEMANAVGGGADAILARFTPYDGGHGLHVGGIAAGRRQSLLIPTFWGQRSRVSLSGVAPMAHVLNYKYDFGSGPEYAAGINLAASPELIAMLDQMVSDQVDVMNFSEGHVTFLIEHPAAHPLSVAMAGASEAGIVVVASAGNAGSNGRSSLSGAFKYSDKMLAVGSVTTPGSTDVELRLEGPDRPASSIFVAPRGALAISGPLSAPLVRAPEGGCVPHPSLIGAIALVLRWEEGECGYRQRATTLKLIGARAVIFYYNDRFHGGTSTTPLDLPAVAIGHPAGQELLDWLATQTGPVTATLMTQVVRGANDQPDRLAGSSSRGPGIDWTLKPDLSAPGVSVISSTSSGDADASTPGWSSFSGTSMASPQVAGAAGLLRSVHPDWTAAQVRSTLINTSIRAIIDEDSGELTDPTQGGSGRLDLRQALSPGLFLAPATASFGSIVQGESRGLTVTVESAAIEARHWKVVVEPGAGGGALSVEPETFGLGPGETTSLTLSLDTSSASAAELWGELHIEALPDEPPPEQELIFLPMLFASHSRAAIFQQLGSWSGTRTSFDWDSTGLDAGPDQEEGPEAETQPLRLVYYAHVDDPDLHKDVLLVNWTVGDTPDYGPVYRSAMDEAGLSHDVYWIDEDAQGSLGSHPSLERMQRYRLVILNTNMSRFALQERSRAYQYLNHLLAGGNLLIAGQGPQDWWTVGRGPNNQTGASQNDGCDMCLSRYMAGFQFGITSTLSARLLTWPERPDEPEMEVRLEPHPDAGGVGGIPSFDFALDLSTGALAKDGAAGNQYRFASGGILGDYDETREHPYTESAFARARAWSRPLWTYDGRVVGTQVAGRHHPESLIPWNAMFWGFGLEGVGKAGDDTMSRAELIRATYDFLAGP